MDDSDSTDPLELWLDSASEDGEPLTPEEESAIEEGWDAYRRDETRPWSEVRAVIGLGRSGVHDTARNIDAVLDAEWPYTLPQ